MSPQDEIQPPAPVSVRPPEVVATLNIGVLRNERVRQPFKRRVALRIRDLAPTRRLALCPVALHRDLDSPHERLPTHPVEAVGPRGPVATGRRVSSRDPNIVINGGQFRRDLPIGRAARLGARTSGRRTRPAAISETLARRPLFEFPTTGHAERGLTRAS